MVLAVIIVAFVYTLPSLNPALWPHKKINLGLDLQGGMHLVLEVDTVKAVESTIERIAQELSSYLKKEHIRYVSLDRVNDTQISVNIKDQKSFEKFEEILDREFEDLRILSKSTDDGIFTTVMDLPDSE